MIAALIALQGGGALLSAALVLSVTAVLGLEAYGRFAWIAAAGGLAGLLWQRGLAITIVKRCAPLDLSRPEETPAALRVLLRRRALIACAALGAALLGPGPQGLGSALWILATGASLSFCVLAGAVLRAGQQALRATLCEQVLRAPVAMALIWAAAPGRSGLTLCLAANAAGALASALFLLPLLCRRGGPGAAPLRPDPGHARATVARSLGNPLPVVVAGLFFADATVAYLALALRLAAPVTFGLTGARALFGAEIVARLRAGDALAAQRAVGQANRLSGGIGLLLAAGLALALWGLAHSALMPALGDRALILRIGLIILAAQLLLALGGPVQLIVALYGGEGALGRVNGAALILLAVLLCLGGVLGRIELSAGALVAYALALVLPTRAWLASRLRGPGQEREAAPCAPR